MPTPRIYGLALTILALLATPALGSPCAGIPKFDTPLAAEPAIRYHRPAVILSICDRNRALAYVFACADEVENVIYLTAPEHLRYIGWTDREIACLERHERAHLWHVDGTRWAGDHREMLSR